MNTVLRNCPWICIQPKGDFDSLSFEQAASFLSHSNLIPCSVGVILNNVSLPRPKLLVYETSSIGCYFSRQVNRKGQKIFKPIRKKKIVEITKISPRRDVHLSLDVTIG